jgi:hypothetical protein
LTLHDSVRIPDEVAMRRVGEETFLLDLNTGVYFGLDAVGSRFVELLENNGEIAVAHRVMLQEFEVTAGVLETDLLRLAEEMCAKRLLVVETNSEQATARSAEQSPRQ